MTGAAFVYNVSETQDALLVASAAGAAQATAVEKVFTAVDQKQGRTLTVDEVVPAGFFGGAQTGCPLLILGAYAVLGILLSMLLCALKPRTKTG